MEMVRLSEVRFPATSLDWNSISRTPSWTLTLDPELHSPISSRYRIANNPEVASEPEAVRVTGEMYQPLDPSTVGADTVMPGGVVSSLTVPLVEAVFPAISETTAVKL
jgi:hypothetical protein